jgi:hypothetical protein
MTKTKKNSKGGKVLASGGFGCVFTPALKCKNTNSRENNKVSKLMGTKYAREEYDSINNIKRLLEPIKNYEDYFILDANLCEPAKLTESDLVDYNKKCSALQKDKITKANINTKVDKLMILNLPYGGIPVDDYIYQEDGFDKLYEVHLSLISLLKNGIIPMNQQNVYHNDIKDSNVLVEKFPGEEMKTRLIDWGLASEFNYRIKDIFLTNWRNNPFQYNVPFSSIIFSDFFIKEYVNFINNTKTINVNNIKVFVENYIDLWNTKRGIGHYEIINRIFYLLYDNKKYDNMSKNKKLDMIKKDFTIPIIVKYITSILVRFKNNPSPFDSLRSNQNDNDNYDSNYDTYKDTDSVTDSDNDNETNIEFSDVPSLNISKLSLSEEKEFFRNVPSETVTTTTTFFKGLPTNVRNKKNKDYNLVKAQLKNYLENIFIKNVDIWGFINCYWSFILVLYEKYPILKQKEKKLFNHLKVLYTKFLHSTSIKPINLPKLFIELDKITIIFQEINRDPSSYHNIKISTNNGAGRNKTRKRKH